LGPLRSQHVFPPVRRALSRAQRPESFRIVQFSLQDNHLHLIVEASDKTSLSRGMRGLVVRLARAVNQLLMRKGSLWVDRWHSRALTSPRQVRNALVYVLANFRKHSRRVLAPGADPLSSALFFDGWRVAQARDIPLAERGPPVAPTGPSRTLEPELGRSSS
jgi:putative transposase